MNPPTTTILDGVRLLAYHGGVVEVRIPTDSWKQTVSGYFDNLDALVAAVTPWDGLETIYITANPVKETLLARSYNRLQERVKVTTKDDQILRRAWFLLDFDATRDAGISATDIELAAAQARRDDAVVFLGELGFPTPALALSGNGAHADYRVDLPNDDATRTLVEQALKALGAKFSDNVVGVDESVFNASRIWKLYGTRACKGDAIPGRPHRRALLEQVPAEWIALEAATLALLAAMAPTEAGPSEPSSRSGSAHWSERLDVAEAFRQRDWYLKALTPPKHAVRCPWIAEHSGDSGITETVLLGPFPTGAPWGFDCKHAHCAHRTITDVYRLLRPARGWTRAIAPEAEVPWPTPQPAPSGLLPVPRFDAAMLLPPALAAWVADVAERAQCPQDFVAVGVLVAAAAVVGRQLTIRPKIHDDWIVVPNLWGLAVGRPGLMKTAAMQEAQRGLRRLMADAREAYHQALKQYEFDVIQAKARRSAIEKQIKAAAERGESTEALREAFDAATIPEPPTERRYVVNDATVEKLGVLLNENPNGLLLFRDELMGFLRTMDREGHQNDRSFYCEAWNGTGTYTYDRIARGTLYIEAACVSILGGIQPTPLAHYLHETFAHGQDDGLIQRHQLLVYPDVVPGWKNVDHWPDTEARQRLVACFLALNALDLTSLGAHTEDAALPFLRFTPEAQTRFDAWRQSLESRLRTTDEHPILISHFAKYRSLVPSLALLFHLLTCVDRGQGGPVSETALEVALAWCAYLEPHARRVYQQVTNTPEVAAAALAAKISAGLVPSPFRARPIRLKGWAGLSSPEEMDAAIELLQELGWLRRVERPSTVRGGRPTVEYEINPAVRRPA